MPDRVALEPRLQSALAITREHLKTIYALGSTRNTASVWANDHKFSPGRDSPALALIVSSVEMIKPTTDPAGARRKQRSINGFIFTCGRRSVGCEACLMISSISLI